MEVAEVATELEEALTEASAATAGEAASSRAGMGAVGATRATTRDSPSTGGQVEATGTRVPPGEGQGVTCRAAPAMVWEVVPATVATVTTGPTVAEVTGLEEDSGGRGVVAGTRTEGINGVDAGW